MSCSCCVPNEKRLCSLHVPVSGPHAFPSSLSPQFLSLSLSLHRRRRRTSLSHQTYSLSTFWYEFRKLEGERILTRRGFDLWIIYIFSVWSLWIILVFAGNGLWNVRWHLVNCRYFLSGFGFFSLLQEFWTS